MLQTFRDKMSGPIVWGIIGFLVLLFAVWGIGVQSFVGGGSDPTIAQVGGVKITQSQYRNAYNRAYQQLVQMMGSDFSPDKVDLPKFRQGVLDDMLRNTLLDQYAKRAGYRTSDRAVYSYLTTIPAFQDDGHFSATTYQQALARNGMSPDQFENQVRSSLRVEQLRNTVLGTALIVPKQAQTAWQIDHQSRDFTSVVFDPAQYASQIEIGDAQVKQRYDSDKARYVAPLKIKLAYLELSQDKLAPSTPPDQDVLKTLYEAQKANRFTIPEERHASHILIPFGADAEAAHKKIEAIAVQLAHGADFAKLAKADSQDPGSKDKAGDLGWIRSGMMDPAFEKVLFALAKPGDASAPVKTKFGWHLIKLDQIRPKHTLAFDDPQVQKQLLQTFGSKASARLFQDDSDKLSELAFENTASLDPVAKALGLQVQTSEWLTRKGSSGIFAKQQVLDAAFSDTVLKDGENSKPIQIGPADLLVIRKADVQPEHQQSLEDVKSLIRLQLLTEAETAKAKAAAQSLLQALKKGQPLAVAAKAAGAGSVTPMTGVTRQKPLDKVLLDAVFRLPKPVAGKSSLGLVELGNGKVAVISLDALHEPGPQAPGTETSAFVTTASQLNNSLAGAEFDAYRDYMKSRITVEMDAAPQTGDAQNPNQ